MFIRKFPQSSFDGDDDFYNYLPRMVSLDHIFIL